MSPKILEAAVKRIKAKGGAVNPYAAAVSTLQKSGSLKKGTLEPTKQGVKRGQMTERQRQKNPPSRMTPEKRLAKALKPYST